MTDGDSTEQTLTSPPPDSAPLVDLEVPITEARLETPDGERLFSQSEMNRLLASERRKDRAKHDLALESLRASLLADRDTFATTAALEAVRLDRLQRR